MRSLVFSLAVVALFAAADCTIAADLPLTGNMVWWQQALGRWDCTLRLYAVAGQPNGTGKAQLVIESAPGNTVHEISSAADYRASAYIGYSDAARKWWETDADNNGYATLSTSNDGLIYTEVSDATLAVEQKNDVFRVRYALDNGVYIERQEWLTKSGWVRSSVNTCSRTRF